MMWIHQTFVVNILLCRSYKTDKMSSVQIFSSNEVWHKTQLLLISKMTPQLRWKKLSQLSKKPIDISCRFYWVLLLSIKLIRLTLIAFNICASYRIIAHLLNFTTYTTWINFTYFFLVIVKIKPLRKIFPFF